MLDISLFRNNPDIIRESERKRFRDPANVDQIIDLDKKWRASFEEVNKLRQDRNETSKEISKKAKAKENINDLKNKVKVINEQIKSTEVKVDKYLNNRNLLMKQIGNILHESVPVAETEDGNKVIKKWGKIRKFDFKPKGHADIVVDMDKVDLERAAKISGARFYYLKEDLVFLNLALLKLGLDILKKHNYTIFQTPFMISHKYMAGAAELSDFEDTLYKIEGEDLFLIATSEQALVSFHADEILRKDKLPLYYGAMSTNFRKEAGTSGKDTKGIFRVHQFEKVEQFVFCDPEDSWNEHERLIKVCEEMFQSIEIPYQVVDIASGDLNLAAARKFDLEGWFPAQNRYRELASCSNVTTFQASKLKIRVGYHGGEKTLAHTLNSTLIATERAMCCILENYQQKDGSIEIPKILRDYMGGQTHIFPTKTEKQKVE